MRRLASSDDRGAVAVTTALVLSAILLTVAAFAVDAGALYAEKRELQNVADFAALAIADDCVYRPSLCNDEDAEAKAKALAAANSTDATAAVDVTLEPGKVTVLASTCEEVDGDGECVPGKTVMPSWFSGADDNGTMVTRAVVTWGAVGWHAGLAFTISPCEWNEATDGGTNFGTDVVTLYFHSPQEPATSTCAWQPPNQDLPGGFGLLEHDADCHIVADDEWWVERYEGSSVPDNAQNGRCASAVRDALNQVLYLPVYDLVCAPSDTRPACAGREKQYHIQGFAAFQLTGYRIGNGKKDVTDPAPCNTNQRCLTGKFLEVITPDLPGGGGFDFGLRTPPKLAE